MMNREVVLSLAWAGGIVAVALAASSARAAGHIDDETAKRIIFGLIGLMIAWQGNRMPKAIVPSASARKATRVAGWSLALSGLVYAGLWAFAPVQVAVVGGCGAVIVGMAVTVAYCLSLRARAKAA